MSSHPSVSEELYVLWTGWDKILEPENLASEAARFLKYIPTYREALDVITY